MLLIDDLVTSGGGIVETGNFLAANAGLHVNDVLVLLDRVADYGEEIWRCLEALYPIALTLGRRISAMPVAKQDYESSDYPLFQEVHREGIAA